MITPCGDLDRPASPALGAALAALPPTLDGVILDMGRVLFMDGAGVRFLEELRGYAVAHSAHLVSFGWQPQPSTARPARCARYTPVDSPAAEGFAEPLCTAQAVCRAAQSRVFVARAQGVEQAHGRQHPCDDPTG
ncbi:STAS domain-containing protein [Streptomyces sp. NPDC006733]|uniref:STAS domain-containing protein n=1 Tax=Streptomyces sp. NPDC006733 TaxID=3155460 RepID=UPI0033F135E5